MLLDGEFIVWDSMAILEYLAEKFPQHKGWPESFEDRAMARSMCAEMHSSFSAMRDELPMNCKKTFSAIKLSDEASEDIERITALWRYFRRRYMNKGPWLFGHSFQSSVLVLIIQVNVGFRRQLSDKFLNHSNMLGFFITQLREESFNLVIIHIRESLIIESKGLFFRS